MRFMIFILLTFLTLSLLSNRAFSHYSPGTINLSVQPKQTWLIQENRVFYSLGTTIHEVTRAVLKDEYRRNNISRTIVLLLCILIILLLVSSFCIVLYVFTIKTLKIYKEKRQYTISRQYMRIIADYVVRKQQSEYPEFPGLHKNLRRKVLIEQIYLLAQNLFGPKQNKLLKLFRIRRLLKHVLFYIAISGNNNKAVYLKLFSVIIPNKYLDNKFKKYLHSQNHELRRFAQLASLNYNINSLDEILKNYPYSLTLWDQIHLLEIIERRSTIPPDFYPYLKSANPTVVIFGLQMIRIFFQKNTQENQLVELLSHPNGDVRYEALRTVTELNVEGVNNLVLAYLSEAGAKHKTLIIKYMIKNNLLDDDTLFKFFFSEEKEVDRLNILETIYNNYPNGRGLLVDFKNYTEDDKIKSMCTYILENAI